MRPMAFRARVMALPSTKAPPVLLMSPFQAMTMMTGSNTTIRDARWLRHRVVRSALRRDRKTVRADGNARGAGRTSGETIIIAGEDVVADIINYFSSWTLMEYDYARTSSPVRAMKTSSRVIFPFREARMTSGRSQLLSMMARGVSTVM